MSGWRIHSKVRETTSFYNPEYDVGPGNTKTDVVPRFLFNIHLMSKGNLYRFYLHNERIYSEGINFYNQ